MLVWLGALLCVAGAVTSLDQFLRGYLIAYMFWTGLSLGCLALLMVQYLSGGLWGLVIRRALEAASKCLPLMFVLFLPILVFRTSLYAWMTNPALTAEEPLVPEHSRLDHSLARIFRHLDPARIRFEHAAATSRTVLCRAAFSRASRD